MISRQMNKNKLTKYNPLEGPSDATAVSLATVYNPNNKHEELKSNMLILFDEGASGSMIKEEIVQDFLEAFGIEQNVEYMTRAGSLACNKRISLQVTFDEFGGATRIHHEFDVYPNRTPVPPYGFAVSQLQPTRADRTGWGHPANRQSPATDRCPHPVFVEAHWPQGTSLVGIYPYYPPLPTHTKLFL
ncbi:predicted protein [Chaetoceros tenuissimus]|uniref:Uncharacterized protein n=1 Tax=Chaetoceros tenuissimus TaxID=426638 RepID=A0AAD3CR93_9STRA|nr:predicted protein [Chaetoceros tenuissimus]